MCPRTGRGLAGDVFLYISQPEARRGQAKMSSAVDRADRAAHLNVPAAEGAGLGAHLNVVGAGARGASPDFYKKQKRGLGARRFYICRRPHEDRGGPC